jgi:GH18 family chitinase
MLVCLRLLFLLGIGFLNISEISCCGEPLKRICYYTSWGGSLPNPPELCTHVIYSFANIEGGVLGGVWSNPLKELKQKNPNIKLMVAVGGWRLTKLNLIFPLLVYFFNIFFNCVFLLLLLLNK